MKKVELHEKTSTDLSQKGTIHMKAVVDIEFNRKNMQRMYAMRMNTFSEEFDTMSDSELLKLCLSSIVAPYAIKVTDINDEKLLKN